MPTVPTTSPFNQYQPQVLLLAPEGQPDDPNLLSLVAQLLEMGIAFELDENWNVPIAPPRDLSAYKSCIFPETTRAKYDNDLNSFYRAGGVLMFDKYYPTAGQTSSAGFSSSTAAYLNVAWGRDLYFYSMASFLYEAGVTLHNPDFRRALESRPTAALLDECRKQFMDKAQRHIGPWREWGDPAWTMLLCNIASSRLRSDEDWRAAVDKCIRGISQAADEALGDPLRFQELPLPGAANNGFENMGMLLMKWGRITGDPSLIEQGVRLMTYYADNVFVRRQGTLMDRQTWLVYSESLFGVPGLLGLARHAGQRHRADTAHEMVQAAIERTQRSDGLWHHFRSLKDNTAGSCWSRAQLWPTIAMTEALDALGPDAPEGELMRACIRKTFDALARTQDPDWGLWHLVVDDPSSRIESTSAAGLLYCHDRLREMNVLDNRHEAMTHRALTGLKRLYYRGGIGASCRGTACGDANYYRSRPQGYQAKTHLISALARRA